MSLLLTRVDHPASSLGSEWQWALCREYHAAKKNVNKNLTEMVSIGFRME